MQKLLVTPDPSGTDECRPSLTAAEGSGRSRSRVARAPSRRRDETRRRTGRHHRVALQARKLGWASARASAQWSSSSGRSRGLGNSQNGPFRPMRVIPAGRRRAEHLGSTSVAAGGERPDLAPLYREGGLEGFSSRSLSSRVGPGGSFHQGHAGGKGTQLAGRAPSTRRQRLMHGHLLTRNRRL